MKVAELRAGLIGGGLDARGTKGHSCRKAARRGPGRSCNHCSSKNAESEALGAIMLCDYAGDRALRNNAYHMRCLPQPLDEVPAGGFICHKHQKPSAAQAGDGAPVCSSLKRFEAVLRTMRTNWVGHWAGG